VIRVVADTNIYISALMFGGLPGSFVELALAGAFLLAISPVLLEELKEKLLLKFEVSESDIAVIETKLLGITQVVDPDIILDVIKDDPDDNRVLECAIAAQVEFVVSGDRHLLKLGTYKRVRIVTVREFLAMLGPVQSQ
jgi:uncharacterized protein